MEEVECLARQYGADALYVSATPQKAQSVSTRARVSRQRTSSTRNCMSLSRRTFI
jgi:hypothetical protein